MMRATCQHHFWNPARTWHLRTCGLWDSQGGCGEWSSIKLARYLREIMGTFLERKHHEREATVNIYLFGKLFFFWRSSRGEKNCMVVLDVVGKHWPELRFPESTSSPAGGERQWKDTSTPGLPHQRVVTYGAMGKLNNIHIGFVQFVSWLLSHYHCYYSDDDSGYSTIYP